MQFSVILLQLFLWITAYSFLTNGNCGLQMSLKYIMYCKNREAVTDSKNHRYPGIWLHCTCGKGVKQLSGT